MSQTSSHQQRVKDFAAIRHFLEPVIVGLRDLYTGERLRDGCERLGLPAPPDDGTKAERVRASFAALPDYELPRVAAVALRELNVAAATRNTIQDSVGALTDSPQIELRTRREIARSLDIEDLATSGERLVLMLDTLWVLDDVLFGEFFTGREGLRDRIRQHAIRNPGDWSTEELFEHLGAFEATDRRFAVFLERLTSADLVIDEAAQRRLVETMNPHLRARGLELAQVGTDGG